MSHKVLGTTKDHKHGLLDDMESLYYVVIYSGIRWLPHNHVDNLGALIDDYFYDYHANGSQTKGGAEKYVNLDSGRFTNLFTWEDLATQKWMRNAWTLQRTTKTIKRRTWTPSNFMHAWTLTLSLNPPRLNRFEHKIRGVNSNSTALPATNTSNWYSKSQMSDMATAPRPLVRDLKRPFEEIMTFDGKCDEDMSDGVANESNTSTNSKRLRPILDPNNNPFITKNGSQC